MPWAPLASTPSYTVLNDMSAGGLTIMAIVIVLCLGFLLIAVVVAGREPRRRRPESSGTWLGTVQGGMHVGEGRSVAPHRYDEAEPASAAQRARDVEARAVQADIDAESRPSAGTDAAARAGAGARAAGDGKAAAAQGRNSGGEGR